ncbi:hypothetical protein GE09DRAFT_1199630 [Coniochaeta sp. 2T2.1]|nr:hypothetical protein GE09DRAFT_1199630 [Coniochaeta sp. 2T2.1]
MALKSMPSRISHRHIAIITRNQSAIAAIRQPRQQSGQGIIMQIYEAAKLLKQRGNSINVRWVPAEGNFAAGSEAKAGAQRAAKDARTRDFQLHQAKSTTIKLAMTKHRRGRTLPQGVGKFSKAMDAASTLARRVRLVCMRSREGNGGTFPPTVCDMDSFQRRFATMHGNKARESFLLPGRQNTVRPEGVDARYEGNALATGRLERGDDQALDQSQ